MDHERMAPYWAIGLSAVLLFLAYACPYYLGLLSLVFLLPLFMQITSLRFIHGLLWGSLFWGMHLYPLADILYWKGQGDLRMILYPILVLFFALHSGLWFGGARYLRCVTLWAWPIVTFVYFVWMQCGVLWVFDVAEGYPFSLPIVPLAAYDAALINIDFIGPYGMTAIIIMLQWWGTRFLHVTKNRNKYVCFIALSSIIFLAPLSRVDDDLDMNIDNIFFIQPPSGECTKHPRDMAQQIAQRLQRGIEYIHQHDVHNPCFILPESAYPFVWCNQIIRLWQTVIDDNNAEIIIGTHEKRLEKAQNVLLHLNKCRIIQSYAKKHATVFTERVPFYLNQYEFFTHLFGGKTDRSIHSLKSIDGTHSTTYLTVHSTYYYPVLCSEFFFNGFSTLPYKKVPILLLCNDSWFSTNQNKYLCRLYAKLYAKAHRRPIFLISHSHGIFFPQTGRARALPTIA